MPRYSDPILRLRARELRSAMTDAEIRLWARLKGKKLDGERWHRQRPIGHFIVDFYCPARRLIVEVDGSQHLNEQKAYDEERSAFLIGRGFTVLRFDNRQVLTTIDAVCAVIRRGVA